MCRFHLICTTFWSTFTNVGLLLYSNVWSHCCLIQKPKFYMQPLCFSLTSQYSKLIWDIFFKSTSLNRKKFLPNFHKKIRDMDWFFLFNDFWQRQRWGWKLIEASWRPICKHRIAISMHDIFFIRLIKIIFCLLQ